MSTERRTPILELRGITKRFGAVQALSGVDLEVFPGEVVALVGDNGAGKSTLIKTIAGIFPPDSGEVRFAGQAVTLRGPKDASRLGIATVYQDLALCDNLDVVANLFLGREEIEPLSRAMNEEHMERRALSVLRTLNVTLPSVRTPIAALSGGQRQSVAVARAVMGEAKLVMLDEPTAALGVAQTKQVLELITRLKQQGLGVLVISHNLADVFEISDRIVVLRLGQLAGAFTTSAASREQVVGRITGAEVAETRRAG
ncbi:ATP-binding cassette domain-containing protein [Sorangium sp. So ce726]|uniref:ATP-binding cassette domain-containing protein n=1 Tax=Sorangium sp. So ce726 TaxID=3133319 RepID=UPI003F5E6BD8